MSGGGKPKKGRILVGSASKLNSNGEDLGRLAMEAEQEFVEISRSFEMIKEKRQSTKKTISEAGKVIDKLRVDIPKAEMEIEAALQQVTESDKILKDLKDKVSLTPSDKKRLDDLKHTIATA